MLMVPSWTSYHRSRGCFPNGGLHTIVDGSSRNANKLNLQMLQSVYVKHHKTKGPGFPPQRAVSKDAEEPRKHNHNRSRGTGTSFIPAVAEETKRTTAVADNSGADPRQPCENNTYAVAKKQNTQPHSLRQQLWCGAFPSSR